MERYIFTEENRRLMKYRWMWRHGAQGIFGLYGPVGSGKTLFLEDVLRTESPAGFRRRICIGRLRSPAAAGAAAFRSDPCIMERIVSLFRTLT